ncbi:MAG: hypothetical protein ACI8RD_011786, partial [Bacillariaceae sp.]
EQTEKPPIKGPGECQIFSLDFSSKRAPTDFEKKFAKRKV